MKPLLFIVFLGLVARQAAAASLLINDSFTGSLASWTASGTVFNTGDSAVFSDSVAAPTSIFQSVAAPSDFAGFDLTFDFFNGLSSTAQPGFVPDVFFATLYLGIDPFGPSLGSAVFDQVIPLFDLDHTGAFNLAAGATVGASPKGAGWVRYSLTRQTAPSFTDPGFLTVAFEFFNLNGTGSDSVVAVDNVNLAKAVPEPGRSLLAGVSLLLILFRRRR